MLHILWSIAVGFVVGLIARALVPGADVMVRARNRRLYRRRPRSSRLQPTWGWREVPPGGLLPVASRRYRVACSLEDDAI